MVPKAAVATNPEFVAALTPVSVTMAVECSVRWVDSVPVDLVPHYLSGFVETWSGHPVNHSAKTDVPDRQLPPMFRSILHHVLHETAPPPDDVT